MAREGGRPEPATGKLRCAIYTRKSTEEGLEQDFNSLDAQREACAAYITSQRHEGWTLVPEYYDDGGFSGGNMERPALKALLAHVAAGKVDVIVLYKVDRLTRSLADFAKIVEVLDRAGASFVSVTQSFNTTTSMGRLMLNVLLSFAQFEREVTGERIRDKIAASKARGMWMGGTVPLGYDVDDRKLVVNLAEAATVRMIFERYLALGSGPQLQLELERDGIRSKARVSRDGNSRGGRPITRGPLYAMLQNRLYLGEVVHKGVSYPGQHEAIVDAELFERVQRRIAVRRVERRHRTNAAEPSLLTGLLHDGHGRVMSPSHTAKGARRYRYYISQPDGAAGEQPRAPRWRAGAIELERVVIAAVNQRLQAEVGNCIATGELNSADITTVKGAACRTSDTSATASGSALRALLLQVIRRIDVSEEMLTIQCDFETVESRIAGGIGVQAALPPRLVRIGKPAKMVIPASQPKGEKQQNPGLISLLGRAMKARAVLVDGKAGTDADEIGRYSGVYQATLLRLSYLAPDIVTAILEGHQPPTLTSTALLRATNLPSEWSAQRRALGFV